MFGTILTNYKKILGSLILSCLIFSCSQTKAPVVNRGSIVYNRAYINENITQESEDFVVIVSGDNVYKISKKYNIPIRDLISQNNLYPPYVLRVGDKISLPNTQYHQVVSGDTLYDISRQYGMNINNLISINDLQKPYYIKTGERLKISITDSITDSKSSVAYNTKGTTHGTKNVKIISHNLPSPEISYKNNRFSWPIKGVVVSKFGPKPGGLYNDGINIKSEVGNDVRATDDGVVAYVGDELRGYGNLIIVKHSSGWISAYGHLEKTKVTRGSKVKKDEIIATVGDTGNVTTPQLYFGLRKGREAVNPQTYL